MPRRKRRSERELESLASSDALTSLLNRRGFENFFMQELARTRRHNTFGSVMLLIDLDKFKEINDTYGHQAGDACLKKVADCLLKNVRSVDAAARIGGDEFAVMLSHTDPEKAANCVHQIKRALNGLQTVWNGITIHISASVGIKHVSENSSFEIAYLAADKALYNDKKNRKQSEDISMTNIAPRQTGSTPPGLTSPNIIPAQAGMIVYGAKIAILTKDSKLD